MGMDARADIIAGVELDYDDLCNIAGSDDAYDTLKDLLTKHDLSHEQGEDANVIIGVRLFYTDWDTNFQVIDAELLDLLKQPEAVYRDSYVEKLNKLIRASDDAIKQDILMRLKSYVHNSEFKVGIHCSYS